ncbi:helix-turn-helix transcriptional regulator [Phaeovulum sp.]|uniref:helix-turn-helix transcriptional regulator n=1 Tax=Phaeovulum sp. TaxID=2934796 RepID=UPI0039E6DB8E
MNQFELAKLVDTIADRVVEKLSIKLENKVGEIDNNYLTTAQVAKMTGFTVPTLENYRATRMGPKFYKRDYNVRYLAADVRKWMEANPIH